MSLQEVNRKYRGAISTIGKSALSALYPKEFEFYMLALELTDYNDNTIDYFAFPIMPENMQKSEPKRTNVKKSSNGVTVLTSNSFVPEEITIKGNFGRTFKFTLNPKAPSVQGVAFSVDKGIYDLIGTKVNNLNFNIKLFDIGIKTGFGAFNILRAICNKSTGVDKAGNPFKLYMYNMALGESYLVTVKPNGFVSTQAREKNMIWDYNVSFDIIAPLEAVSDLGKKLTLAKQFAFGAVQKEVNSIASRAASLL